MTKVIFLGDVDKTLMSSYFPINTIRAKAIATEMANGNINEFHLFSIYSASQIPGAPDQLLRSNLLPHLQEHGVPVHKGISHHSNIMDKGVYGSYWETIISLEKRTRALSPEKRVGLKDWFYKEQMIIEGQEHKLSPQQISSHAAARDKYENDKEVKSLLDEFVALAKATFPYDRKPVSIYVNGTPVSVSFHEQAGKKHMLLLVMMEAQKNHPNEDIVILCADDSADVAEVFEALNNTENDFMRKNFPRIKLVLSKADCDKEMQVENQEAKVKEFMQEVRTAIKTSFPDATDKITRDVSDTDGYTKAAKEQIAEISRKLNGNVILSWLSTDKTKSKILETLGRINEGINFLNDKGGTNGINSLIPALANLDALCEKPMAEYLGKKGISVMEIRALQSTLAHVIGSNLDNNPACTSVKPDSRTTMRTKFEPYMEQNQSPTATI